MRATTQRANTEASLPMTLEEILWLKERVGPLQYEMAIPTFCYGIACGRLWTFVSFCNISVQYRPLQSSSTYFACTRHGSSACLLRRKHWAGYICAILLKLLNFLVACRILAKWNLGEGYIVVFNCCLVYFCNVQILFSGVWPLLNKQNRNQRKSA